MENTYWNHKGQYESLAAQLQKLVPLEGSVVEPQRNKALEKFRKASNCYYDLYNNGLCNRAKEFYGVFKIASSHYKEPWRGYGRYSALLYEKTEAAMDRIVLAAAHEQKIKSKLEVDI